MEMINVVHIIFLLFKISVHPPALLDHLNTRKLSPHFFVLFCVFLFMDGCTTYKDWKVEAHNPDIFLKYRFLKCFFFNSTHIL